MKTKVILGIVGWLWAGLGWHGQAEGRNAWFERFEGELFGGLALPLGEAEYGTKKAGWGIGAEVRYNLSKLPMDLGLRYSFDETKASSRSYHLNSIMLTGDWDFVNRSKFTPFAGIGVGAGWTTDGPSKTSFTVMPRIGVEYNDWLRLSLGTQLSQKYYHNMQVTIGFVLGERKKAEKSVVVIDDGKAAVKPLKTLKSDDLIAEDNQQIYNLLMDKRKYQRRSTTYGVLGGVSLGVGGLLTASGITAFAKNHNGNATVDACGIILTGVGGLCAIGSVPLFIASHKNGVKAAVVNAQISTLLDAQSQPAPALGLNITF